MSFQFNAAGASNLEVLWEDGERSFCRAWRRGVSGEQDVVLVVLPAAEHPTSITLDRLTHEYGLKDELGDAWAVRPLNLERGSGQTALVLDDPGGEPLARLLGKAIDVGECLRLAIGIAAALGKLHQRGLVHKDIKPANILVNCADGQVRLTGFGLASRLPRERQAPVPPETIAGTLAYMAPEQTGRMNRSIDARSDLYALGVTFYQMLTGTLPFTAADPMEWVHCHIARRPAPPAERLEDIPGIVSAIVMKLLSKAAEDRYQSAAGLENDLRRSLAAWESQSWIDDFALGEQDSPDRLFIPEKLYGREREVESLLAVFDRVVRDGSPELVLVSGYSGIGKSRVVNELHRALVPSRALFASVKFDQYKRDIPYATVAQAFRNLIRPLLATSDAELAGWRDALQNALGPNGRLIVDLVPELKHIIGDQPPIPELPAQQAQGRFQLAFRRFIGVFARPEHPLVLFLDDMQWLDAATLDWLEDLLIRSDLQHLMLIGAYRDNEVASAHPLRRRLETIRKTGAKIEEIKLAPLASGHLQQLIADAVRCGLVRAAPLAQLVYEKTGGNAFFAIQFLHALAEERFLVFDHEKAKWAWDLGRIHAKGYSDNVIDLMVGKLIRLPFETQKALQQLARLGNVAEVSTLSIILEIPEEQVNTALADAVRQELVEHLKDSYKFVHDRVQEAAYSLIPEAPPAADHLRIGRLLADRTPPEQLREAVFEIVTQLNLGAALITSREQRERLAELNLIAGQRARASTAYVSALGYFVAGSALLADDCWELRHELIFELELRRAECEFLTGELAKAERRLMTLSTRAATTIERAIVTCLRSDLYSNLNQSERAVTVCLDYLRHLGIEWSPHPTDAQAEGEYDRIWSQLGSPAIEELVELPLMGDPTSLATLDVLTKLLPPALFSDANLLCLTVCRAVDLSLEHGNSDGSSLCYVWFGRIAGARFANYDAAYRFGRVGYELASNGGLSRFQAGTYMSFGNSAMLWAKHIRAARPLLQRAFEIANQTGDLTFAAYSSLNLNSNLLAAGDPLAEVLSDAERGLTFVQKARFDLVGKFFAGQLGLIRTLCGRTLNFGSFDDGQFDELRFERDLAGHPAECWYWIRKLQARFFAGDYEAATDASLRTRPLLWRSLLIFESADYHFYSALAFAACCTSRDSEQNHKYLATLTGHHRQLESWVEHCPENFENLAALVGAEIARIEGRDLDAMRLYELAIGSARANRFTQNEALANELAARFYAARGFEKIAHAYWRDARDCYLRWGADGKVGQLDKIYPQLAVANSAPGPTSTIRMPVDHLDLRTVIDVSQAVTGEIILEKLLDTLMRIAIEQAGAERGLLIVPHGVEQRIKAEAATGSDAIIVHLRDEPISELILPVSILQFVLRTQESVLLEDALAENAFFSDSYITQRHARSILCLPLLNQAKLNGVLYLENNLTAHVFTPARIAVLKLLASQAAISLENARLYGELEERERLSQEMQLELAHANRVATMGQLTASIAHEVNQPIAGILNNAQTIRMVLARQPPNLETADRALGRIVRDATRAGEIIHRIRALAKKAPAQKDSLDINETTLEVVRLTRGEVSKHGIVLKTELAEGLPAVQGDRVQLQQVMLNLIMNAVEAMSQASDSGRELVLRTGIEPGCVLVAVRDLGPGLPEDALERVFEAFYTTKQTGLGMGLSICRSIIEAHGGRLWASANEPKGAVFQFTIPL